MVGGGIASGGQRKVLVCLGKQVSGAWLKLLVSRIRRSSGCVCSVCWILQQLSSSQPRVTRPKPFLLST